MNCYISITLKNYPHFAFFFTYKLMNIFYIWIYKLMFKVQMDDQIAFFCKNSKKKERKNNFLLFGFLNQH